MPVTLGRRFSIGAALNRFVQTCRSLTRLDMSGRNLHSIKAPFFQSLPVLRFLDLSFNLLVELDITGAHFNALETLNVSNNRLEKLPLMQYFLSLVELDVRCAVSSALASNLSSVAERVGSEMFLNMER